MVNVLVSSEVDIRSISGGVMVNVLVWSEVDISSISGGVMVNVLVSSEVDISSISGGVMVNVLVWSEVDISSISGDVMVNVLVTSEVNLRWCQTKDYDNCMCCFFTPHITLRNTSNHWMSRNQNNVSEYCKMTISGQLFHLIKMCF